MSYSAKEDYQTNETAQGYEQRSMYNGFIGKRRKVIENKVIASCVDFMDTDSVILDCPCGNGRWMPALSQKASKIIGRDISTGMVDFAKERARKLNVETDIQIGDAEKIKLDDNMVDYVFSYALMKHLPVPYQYTVMSEFSRVARKGILCSFAVLKPLSWIYWNRRNYVESYPLIPQELENMAKASGLKLEKITKVSQPVFGLEYFAFFSKI